MSLAEVEQARVHITFPKDSLFPESHQPAKASVLVKLRAGRALGTKCRRHLPVDCQRRGRPGSRNRFRWWIRAGNLLNKARQALSPDDPERRKQLSTIARRLNETCRRKSPRRSSRCSGSDKFRLPRRPTATLPAVSRARNLRSHQIGDGDFAEDRRYSGGTTASGVPGTASNLPRPTSRPGMVRTAPPGEPRTSPIRPVARSAHASAAGHSKEDVGFHAGGYIRTEGAGPKAKRIIEPPSADKLKVIHDLVAGVIGFSAERGDQLIVETIPLKLRLNPEPLTGSSKPAPPATRRRGTKWPCAEQLRDHAPEWAWPSC